MALDYTTFENELMAVVKTQWPEVRKANQGGGVWLEDQIKRRSHEDIPFPYAVIAVGDGEDDPEWGTANSCQRHIVEVYYLTSSAVRQSTVQTKLQALKLAVHNASYSGGFQSLGVYRVDTSGENPALQTILDKLAPYDGGSVSWRFLAGETYL